MTKRQRILSSIAANILQLPRDHIFRVGIDGVDGAGKTYFADELAPFLQVSGRPIIRASVDSFHNPRVQRYRLGKHSPQGFFLDSFNYPLLKKVLLDPLSPGGTGRYRAAIFDHRVDAPVSSPERKAAPDSILLFDGIFLHRPALRGYWDYSIFLEVDFAISIPRCAAREDGSPDLQIPQNQRYIEGQKIYMRACEPQKHASLTINNENLSAPYIVT